MHNLLEEINCLTRKKSELDEQLISTEKTIVALETSYIKEIDFLMVGNVVHGYDIARGRKAHMTEKDRIFSATFLLENKKTKPVEPKKPLKRVINENSGSKNIYSKKKKK